MTGRRAFEDGTGGGGLAVPGIRVDPIEVPLSGGLNHMEISAAADVEGRSDSGYVRCPGRAGWLLLLSSLECRLWPVLSHTTQTLPCGLVSLVVLSPSVESLGSESTILCWQVINRNVAVIHWIENRQTLYARAHTHTHTLSGSRW